MAKKPKLTAAQKAAKKTATAARNATRPSSNADKSRKNLKNLRKKTVDAKKAANKKPVAKKPTRKTTKVTGHSNTKGRFVDRKTGKDVTKPMPTKAAKGAAKGGLRAGARTAGRALLGKGPVGTGLGLALLGGSMIGASSSSKKGKQSNTANRNSRKRVTNPRTNRKQGTVGKSQYGSASGRGQRLAGQNPIGVAASKVTGKKKTKGGTYPIYKKKSAAAKTFRASFKDARKKGLKTFTWQGRKYTTKVKK